MVFGREEEDGSLITPWRCHILSIPWEAGRGLSTKTYGLGDMFPPDDLGSGPYSQFIIWVIEMSSL